jgi:SAM-dependent methyltransferase
VIGREQRFRPGLSAAERAYVALFGMPVVGLRVRARNLLALLPTEVRPRLVLDAGSGPGVITHLLARRYPAAQVVGIDRSPRELRDSLAVARRAATGNVSYVCADVRSMPFASQFDLAVAIDVLEHLVNDEAALAALAAVLRPNARLVLHVPALYRRYPVLARRLNFEVPTHVRPGYEPAALATMVRGAGLEILSCGFTYGLLETLANNASYRITRARKENKRVYAVAFPVLNLLSWLGRRARPSRLGAGVYLVARAP